MSDIDKNYCLNCQTPFGDQAKYCFQCGQKRYDKVLELRTLLQNFWETITNFDNSFFQTLKRIHLPHRLTELYVAGQRKTLLNPIKLFIYTFVFFITVMLMINSFDMNEFMDGVHKDYHRSKIMVEFEEKSAKLKTHPEAQIALDSMHAHLFADTKHPDLDIIEGAMLMIDFSGQRRILKKDLIELELEEIYEKHDVKDFWEKLEVRQYVRLNRDQSGSTKFLLGNLGWGLIPSILLLSFVLWLLYRRHHIHYLEHFVLVLNTHSFLFVLAGIFFFIFSYFPDLEQKPIIGFGFSLVFYLYINFISFRYYKQGYFKTLIKVFLASIMYTFISAILVLFVMVISALIY